MGNVRFLRSSGCQLFGKYVRIEWLQSRRGRNLRSHIRQRFWNIELQVLPMKSVKRSNRGSALVIAIILIGAVSIACGYVAILAANDVRQMKYMMQKSLLASVKMQLQTAITTNKACTCQLNGNLAPLATPTPSFIFNSTSPPQTITLHELRSGCDPLSDKIVNDGLSLGEGLTVSSVTFANLQPLSNGYGAWKGTFTVNISQPAGQKPIPPITIDQNVYIDKSNPAATYVTQCAAEGIVSTCPNNWTLVGSPGTPDSFCIETNPSSNHPPGTGTYDQAVSTCKSPNASNMGPATLCTPSQWYAAYYQSTHFNPIGTPPIGTNADWVDMLASYCPCAGYGGVGAGNGDYYNQQYYPRCTRPADPPHPSPSPVPNCPSSDQFACGLGMGGPNAISNLPAGYSAAGNFGTTECSFAGATNSNCPTSNSLPNCVDYTDVIMNYRCCFP